jgi:protein SCO1/2
VRVLCERLQTWRTRVCLAAIAIAVALGSLVVADGGGRQATAATGDRVGALAGYFPNVIVMTHDKRRVRFFDDLIKGRTVAINFMFTTCKSVCPLSTANLRKVQGLVRDRLGKDVLMLSISVDPGTDTPDALARYAAAHDVGPGWLFLTGSRNDIDRIRRRLASTDDDDDPSQHTGMLTYGNEPAGQWRMVNVMAPPEKLARDLLRLADGKFW